MGATNDITTRRDATEQELLQYQAAREAFQQLDISNTFDNADPNQCLFFIALIDPWNDRFRISEWKIGEWNGLMSLPIYISGVTVKNLFPIILGVLIMMTTTGCANSNNDGINVPGNPPLCDYSIQFDMDWDVYDSGTYSYGPEGSTVRRIGGGRGGYQWFYILTLDFKFKDGREYHEKIDIKPLIKEMVKNNEIHDLRKAKWRGSTSLNIKIERDRLIIDYEVSEYVKKENPEMMLYKRYHYPLFEKNLD